MTFSLLSPQASDFEDMQALGAYLRYLGRSPTAPHPHLLPPRVQLRSRASWRDGIGVVCARLIASWLGSNATARAEHLQFKLPSPHLPVRPRSRPSLAL
jgi:hypothetical protein